MFEVELTRFKSFADAKVVLKPQGLSYLAGANNAGKSTLLQAIAIWEFCRLVLENERTRASLCVGFKGQGLGLSDDEFSPVSVASLKHLWTNLTTQIPSSDGYSMAIKCRWEDDLGIEKHLKISLALTNDRLFLKATDTNLYPIDRIPAIAYLPPFAGIVAREPIMTGAERRSMIGRGLAGGIIRNILYEMYSKNREKREDLKRGRSKIKNSDLEELRKTDPWEVLQSTMGRIFETQLDVEPFNDLFHTYIRINCSKGKWDGKKLVKFRNFKSRDLMAEGSGFLQWLNVYALALNTEVDTILLDEPDAHLHPSMQTTLVNSLEEIADRNAKQVILATHSTEILRNADHEKILHLKKDSRKYLKEQRDKIGLFLGLGSDYSPKIDPLRKSARMLLVENDSDANILKNFATVLGKAWPENLVVWPWTGAHRDRKQLFLQLHAEIPLLRALSLRDRDDLSLSQVDPSDLSEKSRSNEGDGSSFLARTWRGRHIENYLLWPPAIARASKKMNIADVEAFFEKNGLVITGSFHSKSPPTVFLEAHGKELIQGPIDSIKKLTKCHPSDIAKAFLADEVPCDVETLIDQIINMCA